MKIKIVTGLILVILLTALVIIGCSVGGIYKSAASIFASGVFKAKGGAS